MMRPTFAGLIVAASAGWVLGGCTATHLGTSGSAQVDQAVPAHLEMAMASELPTFGVGDELGWLAFGDLALAPMPGEPTDVLVIARAQPIDPAGFDWVGQYLALAD